MEKIIFFASEQWLLITLLAAAVAALVWWENRRAGTGLSANGLTTLVNQEGAAIIDLRDVKEYQEGHIVDAISMPFAQWQKDSKAGGSSAFSQYQGKSIVLVCKMGQQSSHVAKALTEAKFEKVYRLIGGMVEWRSAQMPTVKGKQKK